MADDIKMIPEPDATKVAWDLAQAIMKVVNGPDRHPNELKDVLLKAIHAHLNAHRIMVVQDYNGVWKVVDKSGVKFSYTDTTDHVTVPREGDVVEDVPEGAFEKGFISTPEEGVGWDCWIAIHNGDRQRRLLAVDDITDARDYQAYQPSLTMMANMIGEALLLQETVRQDPFTGLPNRLAFQELMEREASRIYRDTDPAAVCLLHIHQADRLREEEVINSIMFSLANHLRSVLPGTEGMIARFGRKSLVALLDNVDLDYAQIWADKLRRTLPSIRKFELRNGTQFELDFNVGLAILDFALINEHVDVGLDDDDLARSEVAACNKAADVVVKRAQRALDLAIGMKTPSTCFWTDTGIIGATVDADKDSNPTPG